MHTVFMLRCETGVFGRKKIGRYGLEPLPGTWRAGDRAMGCQIRGSRDRRRPALPKPAVTDDLHLFSEFVHGCSTSRSASVM